MEEEEGLHTKLGHLCRKLSSLHFEENNTSFTQINFKVGDVCNYVRHIKVNFHHNWNQFEKSKNCDAPDHLEEMHIFC